MTEPRCCLNNDTGCFDAICDCQCDDCKAVRAAAKNAPDRAIFQQALDNRAQRFAKLVALRAPGVVIASEMMLIMKAVAGLFPKDFGQVHAREWQKTARTGFALCTNCGTQHGDWMVGDRWCAACEAELKKETESENDDDTELRPTD